MGGGKSSSSSAPVVTQEQKDQLKAQTGLLTDTLIPAYKDTISGAKANYEQSNPHLVAAAKQGYDLSGSAAKQGVEGGIQGIQTGAKELASLFGSDYEEGQVQAALQSGREATREQLGGQNAMYGGAGGLGSARHALADTNLAQLGAQRQATAAAAARAGVQANRASAATSLIGAGQNFLNTGLNSSNQQVGMANAPMDLYSKYAGVVFGTPGSGGGNFAGTQGSNTSSSGWGFKLG